MEITSPLGTVRKKRHLTLEEAAARARLEVDDVKALEENRIYRFPSVDEALATTLVYATSLGVSEREARELAGLPVPTRARWNFKRWVVVGRAVARRRNPPHLRPQPRSPPLPDRAGCRRSGGGTTPEASPALADPRRRLQRNRPPERRHQGRQRGRRPARLSHRHGQERQAHRLSRHTRLLPAGRRRDRAAARRPARCRGNGAPVRGRPEPSRRDRRLRPRARNLGRLRDRRLEHG